MQNKVLILDFGSQYTQLIARRVRELFIYCEIHPFNKIPKDILSEFDQLSNNLEIKKLNFDIKRSSKFRFSKIENFDYFEPELIADENTFAFFDDKGNLIKFNDNLKTIWKKNYYTKQEKKMKPILTLYKHDKYLSFR